MNAGQSKNSFLQQPLLFFNLEKGYFYTFKNMIYRPGGVVKDYINGNTIKYSNPFRYVLIGITISLFIAFGLGVFDLQQEQILETYWEIGIIDSEEKEQEMRATTKSMFKFNISG